MDILGIANVLDGSGEDSQAVQDMAASLAQQLGSEPAPPRPAQIRNSPSPGVARTIGVSNPTPNIVHSNAVSGASLNGVRPIITAAAPTHQFVNPQTVGQPSNARAQLTAAQRPDSQQNAVMAIKMQESQMRDKVGRLRQLLGRLIEMATQKDQKFGEVMRELVKKLLDGNITDSVFITEIDRIGGIKLSSQAANFPHFLASTLPYLRFQLQQETQAIFQKKRANPSIKLESGSPSVPQASPQVLATTTASMTAAAATTAGLATSSVPAPASVAVSAAGGSGGGGLTTSAASPAAPAASGAPLVNPTALRAFLQQAGQQKMLEALKNPQLYNLFLQRQTQQSALQTAAAKSGQQAAQARTQLATAAPAAATTTTTTAAAVARMKAQQVAAASAASTAAASLSTPSASVSIPSTQQPVASASSTAPATSTPSKQASSKAKTKTKDDAPGDDDNDVTLVGGVNLREETAILTGAEHAPLQTQTCGDQTLLAADSLRRLIEKKVKERGLESATPEVTQLMSHAMEARLRDTLEKLTAINQHRAETYKEDSSVEITTQVRGQLKFLEDVDRFKTKKLQEQQREMLLKAARSRARPDDPEAALLKEKARQVQHEEDELMRKNAANLAALAAIGPRKKRKAEDDLAAATETSGASGSTAAQPYAAQLRTRQRRIGLKDYIFYLEQEKPTRRKPELFKAYLKQT